MKRIIALLLVVLSLLGMTALAEEVTLTRFTLADPVFESTWGNFDLTGTGITFDGANTEGGRLAFRAALRSGSQLKHRLVNCIFQLDESGLCMKLEGMDKLYRYDLSPILGENYGAMLMPMVTSFEGRTLLQRLCDACDQRLTYAQFAALLAPYMKEDGKRYTLSSEALQALDMLKLNRAYTVKGTLEPIEGDGFNLTFESEIEGLSFDGAIRRIGDTTEFVLNAIGTNGKELSLLGTCAATDGGYNINGSIVGDDLFRESAFDITLTKEDDGDRVEMKLGFGNEMLFSLTYDLCEKQDGEAHTCDADVAYAMSTASNEAALTFSTYFSTATDDKSELFFDTTDAEPIPLTGPTPEQRAEIFDQLKADIMDDLFTILFEARDLQTVYDMIQGK